MVKLIDKKSYMFFIKWFIGGVIAYWLIYFGLSCIDMGIKSTIDANASITLMDSLYFSVVTISSLGYGDFRPISVGRFIAMTEVIYGLVIIALIVSKLASERTSTLVRLTYTSDVEKRLREFSEENNKKNHELSQALKAHDFEKVHELSEDFKISFSAYLHFLTFHSREGELEGKWAEKAFLRLLRSVRDSSELLLKVVRLKQINSKERLRCNKALNRAVQFGNALTQRFEEGNIVGNANHIIKMKNEANVYYERFRSGKEPAVELTELTDALLKRVEERLPTEQPWERHIHKVIAKELRISNSLAHKAISAIVAKKAA